MNMAAAIQACVDGKRVRLPEWSGYWFASGTQVKVFTATGDILESPWFDKYENRQDFEITEGKLGFDFAIRALKAGKKVARQGWNGKRMFIFMRPGDSIPTGVIPNIKSLPQPVKEWIDQNLDDKMNPGESGLTPVHFTPYLCMKAADNTIVNGWLASQTDMLAEDWVIVN
jgi:hypothetical protein